MSTLLAYFLGLLTIILIIFPFWILSLNYPTVRSAYESIFCNF